MNLIENINQDWSFIRENVSLDKVVETAKETVSIPHTWNGEDGYTGGNNYHRGICTYYKELMVQENEGRVYLEFEAANSVANVYLNGRHLGEHQGGYSGFRFDITDIANVGKNDLVVYVDNTHIEEIYPLFADFTFYGGIYRNVNVIYSNTIHFEKMDLASSGVFVSQNDISNDVAKFNVLAKINNTTNAKQVTLNVDVKDAEGKVVLSDSKDKVIVYKDEISMDLELANPTLWQGIDNPYLYDIEVQLVDGDTVLDAESIPTGFRYYEFDEDKGFFLNGEHMKLNGVSRHQDRHGVGNALTKEHQVEDMELIKEVGANSIRLAHYQHNKYFYELCDRYGMVVWAEIPYISRTSKTDLTAANAISQMRELVRQAYNHSSIVLWGVQNEVGMMAEEKSLEQISREIHEVVKEEDTTRLTTQAQVMVIETDDKSHYVTDTVAYNKYYGWYMGEAEEFDDFIHEWRKENPNKSLGFSEYGAEGILGLHSDDPKVKDYSEEYHALYHEKCMTIFNKYDFVWGTYVWNFFDFGSDFRDEGGVQGMNNKGLVTFDRTTKKDAFFYYQSIWSKEPMLHITSKRFVDRHLEEIKVKVYSNNLTVSLYVNDVLLETKESDSTIFEFTVKLANGVNTVRAESNGLIDSVEWVKVNEANKAYVLPEEDKKSLIDLGAGENVQNWFDMDLENNGKLEFNYPEGFFSIKTKISELIEHEETKAILDSFLPGIENHPMYEMIISKSVKVIMDFKADKFPKAVQVAINEKLNKISKQ
jgi:beta-galactosidase